ncbi:antibiotic biosynthesis monooxygenase [Lonsdalea britannica]|uniref:Antibiotic biosynthesis monooxygenase n=1 Tax=Lonsdalea britannica TaxID=1082704 RepID=A0AAD0SM29_9GAMM|nr:putative quinol monooxygenase [Lonsdalea britannica]AXW87653.1 antibiotic biosynthesis monooxygenase [Lonsdalea britannica]OSM98218.1 antibiotic biosynthesis monooxygenase [Lonsdalea britannica]OSN09502.1 antibiotic biosynthesis monooxygenase [Lonsdalea britannica]
MEIRVVACLQAKPEYLKEIADAVTKAVEPSRKEAGNLQYDLHAEIDKPGAFVFIERWKNKEALETHEKTAHFQKLVADMEGKTVSVDIKLMTQVA